jgi:hypothetical protein
MANLADAIAIACDLQIKLDRLCSQDAGLSPKAAIAEATRQGGVPAEADRIVKEIESGSADGSLLRGSFNRLRVAIENFARTSIIRPERVGSYIGEATEVLGRLGISRASLVLSVVRHLVKTRPEIWGTQESPTALAAAITSMKFALEESYRKIEAAITLADFTCHEMHSNDRADGKSLLTFKIANDEIGLGDGRDVGARLVGWHLAQRQAKAA